MRKHVLKQSPMCCGRGGGAKGFNRSKPIAGNLQAKWQGEPYGPEQSTP